MQIVASPATKFNGKSTQYYKPWKYDLRREILGLALEAAQWMELLMVRTTGHAHAVVHYSRVLYLETNPDFALQCVWDGLDTRLPATKRICQQLLTDLLSGPAIYPSQLNTFCLFAQDCKVAVELQSQQPDSIALLSDPSSQNSIVNRLDSRLVVKWYESREETGDQYIPLQFKDFAKWIMKQARTHLRKQNSQPEQPRERDHGVNLTT